MNPQTTYSEEFLYHMPKSDLHLHLDGSLRIESMLEMAKDANVSLPETTVEGPRKNIFKDKPYPSFKTFRFFWKKLSIFSQF